MMQSVQVIIERLKTNPEDFFGGDDSRNRIPKFRDITDKLDDLLIDKKDVGHIHRLWYLEPEEKAALLDAYKEARRARFEAQVFHTLLTEPEIVPVSTVTQRYHPHTGKPLMQGPSKIIAPRNMLKEATELLEKEFDKVYAENRNTRP
jgi:hypothetical protein